MCRASLGCRESCRIIIGKITFACASDGEELVVSALMCLSLVELRT